MMCVQPRELVKKYQQYAHGDSRQPGRRVVLDESMLENVRDINAFPGRNDLKDTFLTYVSEACKKTIGTDRPVLFLVFGHGPKRNYSITIGGTKTL